MVNLLNFGFQFVRGNRRLSVDVIEDNQEEEEKSEIENMVKPFKL